MTDKSLKKQFEGSLEDLKNGRYKVLTNKPLCPICNKPMLMVNAYEYKTTCKHMKNLRVSIG